jgi:serine protease Do
VIPSKLMRSHDTGSKGRKVMVHRGGLVVSIVCAASLRAVAGGEPQVADADRAAAVVIVEGVARGAYRNVRPEVAEAIVPIAVKRSELGAAARGAGRPAVPAPGELVYVHVSGSTSGLPAEGADLRAFLAPRAEGGWQGAAASWYESTTQAAKPEPKPAPPLAGGSSLDALGLSAEEMKVQNYFALKVTALERGSPAQKAGLEPGDMIVGIDGKPLAGAETLADRVRQGGSFEIMVVDINTGKVARVPITIGAAESPASTPSTSGPAPRPSAPSATPGSGSSSRSLGVSAEPVSLGPRTALKVSRVTPDSPGAKAGLEPGDVIVAANGAPITGVEQLAAALRKSGPTLELTVRDTRTGKDVAVSVALGGSDVVPPMPSPAPAHVPAPPVNRGGADGGLGAVTELVFLDTEAAVKVTEVRPGSPAAQAGIEPGDVIVEADGMPVLHPNDLLEATRNAGVTMTLGVLSKGAGRKQAVKVSLGGR